MTARRALVTGASGFVGANLVRRLLADGHDVHATGRTARDRWRLSDVAADLPFHDGDLAETGTAAAIVKSSRPDWVFHLAAYGAYPHQDNLGRAVRTNVLATAELAEACLDSDVTALIHTGSSSEYGLKDHAPLESEAIEPTSNYAVTKASATILCRHLGLSRRAPLVTLRLYSVYGPFEEPSRLIPAIVLEGLRGRLPPLAGPDIARDFLHVDDAVDALILAAGGAGDHPGAVFNLGTGVQTTLRDVIALARELMGVEAAPEWGSMPDRRWDTPVWVANNELIQRRLGWRPRRGLAAGLRQTIDWFSDHPEMCSLYEARRAAHLAGGASGH